MKRFVHLTDNGEENVEFEYSPDEGRLTIGGHTYECDGQNVWLAGKRTPFWVHKKGISTQVWLDGEVFTFLPKDPRQREGDGGRQAVSTGTVKAQMPGKILSVSVRPEQAVTKGQNLFVMESMKMELALDAPFDGTVETVEISVGQMVAQGDVLVKISPAGE